MSIAAQTTSSHTALYSDFQNLASLRSDALKAPTEAIDEVATHFESLFMQMMLKSMREATIDGGLFNSNQMETYQSMFDQQISLEMSQQGKLGLKDILVDQLGGEKSLIEEQKKAQPIVSLNDVSSDMRRQILGMIPAANSSGVRAVNNADSADGSLIKLGAAASTGRELGWVPESPEQFIRDVWDHAVNAASELGLDPEVLVAQSALETGWGKKVIRAADGSSSFNLFGIKANNDWAGNSAVVNTVEYRDGLASIEKAAFRVYDSLASSFSDYVSFLKANPRYQQALGKVSDSSEFLSELQSAGYATDPQYAEKIMNIVSRDTLGSVVGELKNLAAASISG